MTAVFIGPTAPSFQQRPFFDAPAVSAGFPNPAENEIEKPLSLDELLIGRPSSTFFLRLQGSSMEPTIPDGSILVVDRSVQPRNGRIVVVSVDDQFLVKELVVQSDGRKPYLRSHNRDYPDIVVEESADSLVWGCVVGFAKRL